MEKDVSKNVRSADIKISLKSDCKYSSKIEARISANQWSLINRIIECKDVTNELNESITKQLN